MVVRDELLLIFDLTSTLLRAGVGVHDLIRGPLIELPTRVGRMAGKSGHRVEDFLVGAQLAAAEAVTAAGGVQDFDIIDPIRIDQRTGAFHVTDWNALEAVFRYAMHTSLQLQRPPLAHPTVLSIPPNLSPSTVDQLHRLLFERLLVPQVLVSTRPFFAAGAAGILSGVVVDIGYRGEGTEISAMYENQVVPAASDFRIGDLDEGVCDDYCLYKILEADPTIEQQLLDAKTTAAGSGGQQPVTFAPGELANAMRRVVSDLKVQNAISFESPLLGSTITRLLQLGIQQAAGEGEEGEEGTLDVAKAIVEGKVDEIVRGGGDKANDDEEGGQFVRVSNPYLPAATTTGTDASASTSNTNTTLRIGPIRHRYLEPLFFPSVLACLAPTPSSSSQGETLASRLFGTEYSRFTGPGATLPHAGLHEAVGVVLASVPDEGVRNAVSEAVVVVSSGRIANNRALGPALIPLLSPFRSDPSAGVYDPEGTAPSRTTRFAKTPNYFSSFKDRSGDWAVYLGACIMGKLLIGDASSKLFMSKQDYAAHGPAHYRLLEVI
ncbi:hypothetical protein C6P46_001117 [Rhodotorula mucilaginosa]|uniref:Actin-like ATPase domain-containing protein n=1 Tax=Rhodotorula mucilaginosa TaxID=5537 RepID=A0A9P6VTD9_RHOMI|nr:hypothetical protein C6P46_001117 [Rhodotorula mucilaginosa]